MMSEAETIEVVAYATDKEESTGARGRVFPSRGEANELIDELRTRDDVVGFERRTVNLDEVIDDE